MNRLHTDSSQLTGLGTSPVGAADDGRSGDYEIEVFYDGACPLCCREIDMLRKLDRRSRFRVIDISRADFDPHPLGKSWAELMGEIHGRLPDGNWVTGVEVFWRLYAAVGFRTLSAISRAPVVSHILEAGYRLFARNRLRLTGRCTEGCTLESSVLTERGDQ